MNLLQQRIENCEQPLDGSQEQWLELHEDIRDAFLKAVPPELLNKKHEASTKKQLLDLIAQITKSKIGRMPALNLVETTKEIQDDILGYGPITDFLQDPDIEEIEVNRYDEIWIEKHGVHSFHPEVRFKGESHLLRTIQRIVDETGRRIDESFPMVDGRMIDGSRFNAVIPPVAPRGANITIRKFKKKLTPEELISNGTFPKKFLEFFQACVKARLNIMVTGGSSTGKTNTLNMLSTFVAPTERIIVIEDTQELDIKQPNTVRLEARLPTAEGKGRVTIRDLVINSLRMRPDRIIVGEVRGGETLDMLQAMNTGHDGSMTTGHANSPEDMLSRLETMVIMGEKLPVDAIRHQISAAFDLFIHLRKSSDGSRKITRVTEVLDVKDGSVQIQDILTLDENNLRATTPKHSPVIQKLQNHGWTV